jgi:hypothetical protein
MGKIKEERRIHDSGGRRTNGWVFMTAGRSDGRVNVAHVSKSAWMEVGL